MKTKGIFTLCLLIAAAFSGCKKENSPIIAVDNGRWEISNFSKNGDDRTAKFSGYIFSFGKKGELAASSGSETTMGSWYYCNDRQMEVGLYFRDAPLNELNAHWKVLDQTDHEMHLGHFSGSENKDYLSFRKR